MRGRNADLTVEDDLPAAAGDETELLARTARKDGKQVVTLRAVQRGLACTVECEVYPVSGLRGMIRPFLGQYEEMHAAVARKLGAGFIDHRPAWARLSDDELAKAIADGTHPDPAVASRVIVPSPPFTT